MCRKSSNLNAVHEGRVRSLPALSQVVHHLFALGEHLVPTNRRQPLEQGVPAQLHTPQDIVIISSRKKDCDNWDFLPIYRNFTFCRCKALSS